MRLFVFVLVVLAASPAAAQGSCPPGQSLGPDTAGRCCWPGQAWSSGRGQCVGIPVCPVGLVASGESCQSAVAAPPPAPTPPPPPPVSGGAVELIPPPPPPPTAPPPLVLEAPKPLPAEAPARQPELHRRPALIVVGAVLIAGGIAAAIGSVPLWQDGFDDGMKPPNTRITGHDGWMMAAGAGLDLLGIAGVTVGGVLLGSGLKRVPGTPAPAVAALPPVRGLEVSLAF